MSGSIVLDLPDDQWITEVKTWYHVFWSQMQLLFSASAAGPEMIGFPVHEDYWRRPSTAGEKQLCGMQKMRRSGGFANINVFGLSFVIAFSLAMLLIDVVLLRLLIFLSKFRQLLSPRIERWIQDGIWQLQSRAYEAQRQGSWENLEKEVPLTKKGDLLSGLPPRAQSESVAHDPPMSPATSITKPVQIQMAAYTAAPMGSDTAPEKYESAAQHLENISPSSSTYSAIPPTSVGTVQPELHVVPRETSTVDSKLTSTTRT
jgi:hypothetical protein